MPRNVRALFLLAVILLQSLTMLSSLGAMQLAGELEHLVFHSQDDHKHHHHEDQALHMDDDDGPVQHFHADSGANTVGLLTSLQPGLTDVRSMSPPEAPHALWLSPTLEGPLRPPRRLA